MRKSVHASSVSERDVAAFIAAYAFSALRRRAVACVTALASIHLEYRNAGGPNNHLAGTRRVLLVCYSAMLEAQVTSAE